MLRSFIRKGNLFRKYYISTRPRLRAFRRKVGALTLSGLQASALSTSGSGLTVAPAKVSGAQVSNAKASPGPIQCRMSGTQTSSLTRSGSVTATITGTQNSNGLHATARAQPLITGAHVATGIIQPTNVQLSNVTGVQTAVLGNINIGSATTLFTGVQTAAVTPRTSGHSTLSGAQSGGLSAAIHVMFGGVQFGNLVAGTVAVPFSGEQIARITNAPIPQITFLGGLQDGDLTRTGANRTTFTGIQDSSGFRLNLAPAVALFTGEHIGVFSLMSIHVDFGGEMTANLSQSGSIHAVFSGTSTAHLVNFGAHTSHTSVLILS